MAGEKSGEEHCLSFFDGLRALCPQVDFWGVGGDELEKRGVDLLYHLRDFSSWGLVEVLGKIPFYMKALKEIEKKVQASGTKTAILVDFQEFNFRLAKRLGKRKVQVLYFGAPQAWAWRAKRAQTLGQCVHTLFSMIPFEKQWFQERGVEKVVSVPHPVYHRFKHISIKKVERDALSVALLPGSRNFEVSYLLPIFLKALARSRRRGRKFKTVLVCATSVNARLYVPYLGQVDTVCGDKDLAEVLVGADYALAASGTVTLACALFCLPTVVAYKASLITDFLFSFFSYKGHVALANIVCGEKVFPEFIQERATSFNVACALERWIDHPEEDIYLREKLTHVRDFIRGDRVDVAKTMAEVINQC